MTLRKEITSVFSEKPHFYKLYEWFIQTFFLEILDYQNFDAMTNITGSNITAFFIEFSSTAIALSIETLIEQNKPVIAERSQFE